MVICVAGPIAAGKNFVCSILEERGFFCLDADQEIHKIIGEKQAEILSRFSQSAASRGINLRSADGSLDRRALGKLLFKDPALLSEQEKILYPEFVARVQALIDTELAGKTKTASQPAAQKTKGVTDQNAAADSSANQKALVDQNARGLAINAALLYKTPSLLRQCQKIIYVDAPLLVRAWRIRRRDRLPLLQIIRRIKSQKGLMQEYERFAADYGIEMVRVWNWGSGVCSPLSL
jgi:dephospho-CoA kinase